MVSASTPAAAICFQGSGVGDALDYLVCLHNEQSRTLNNHADTINAQAGQIDELADRLRESQRRIADLINDLNDARTDVARLRVSLEMIQEAR